MSKRRKFPKTAIFFYLSLRWQLWFALSNHVRFASDTPTLTILTTAEYRRHFLLRILTAATDTVATIPLPPRHLVLHFPTTLEYSQALPLFQILTAAAYTATTVPLTPRHLVF